MALIPDINATEKWRIENPLRERYGEKVEDQLADAETALPSYVRELSVRPLNDPRMDGCHFTTLKSGDKQYRSRFFYKGCQQHGTGVQECDDLAESAVSLLQAQVGHEAAARDEIRTTRT
jgi:hypothetical protein